MIQPKVCTFMLKFIVLGKNKGRILNMANIKSTPERYDKEDVSYSY